MAGCLKCSCYYIEPHPQVSTFASNTGSNVTKSPAYATASEMGAEKDSTTLKLGEIYSDKLSSHSLGVYVRFRDSHRDVCQRMLAVIYNPGLAHVQMQWRKSKKRSLMYCSLYSGFENVYDEPFCKGHCKCLMLVYINS